ncbi:MAG TPA: PadR family transcriptional regulator, partial [Actinomycetes bacterium]|nr:PadR family transcriptional regulator [Actinomycetes bacterium]
MRRRIYRHGHGPGPPGGWPPGPPGPWGFGGRRRGRRGRGDVRAAILALLAERPMHGYEMIQEL